VMDRLGHTLPEIAVPSFGPLLVTNAAQVR
jgi:hypothetical protein